MDTLRFALPLLIAGQAQKEVTHNEAVTTIDRLLHLTVQSRQRTVPPVDPVAGQSWIIPEAASGAWAGRADLIASHDGFSWRYDSPVPGMIAYVDDEAGFIGFAGAWSAQWPAGGLAIGGRAVLAAAPAAIAAPSGGSVVDAESRNAINMLIAALQAQGVLA